MIEWSPVKHKYGPDSLRGKIGKIQAFSIFWDVMAKTDRDAPYTAKTALPGYKVQFSSGRFKTVEDAKKWCEEFFDKWVASAGLIQK